MYQFIKTATGWRVYWGPVPREEAAPQEQAAAVTAPTAGREAYAAAPQGKPAILVESLLLPCRA